MARWEPCSSICFFRGGGCPYCSSRCTVAWDRLTLGPVAFRSGELAALGLLDSGARLAGAVGIVIMDIAGITEKSREGG